MPVDSPEVCAARRQQLADEVREYEKLPVERRRAVERDGGRRRPRPACPTRPCGPDALIEVRVSGCWLAVKSPHVDTIAKTPTELVAAILKSLPMFDPNAGR